MADEGGPILQKIAGLEGIQFAGPVERLRKVHFQQAGDAVGMANAVVDEFSPVFGQYLQPASFHGIGNPGAEAARCKRSKSIRSSASEGSSLAPLTGKASR